MAEDGTGGLHYTRDVTDPVETAELTYSNPHRQRVGPRWVRGEVVWAMPLGIVHADPSQTWANEYVPVYTVEGPDGRAERVPGQYGIYDSKPGDPNYSPIWRCNYVVVPRDYVANTSLRTMREPAAIPLPQATPTRIDRSSKRRRVWRLTRTVPFAYLGTVSRLESEVHHGSSPRQRAWLRAPRIAC